MVDRVLNRKVNALNIHKCENCKHDGKNSTWEYPCKQCLDYDNLPYWKLKKIDADKEKKNLDFIKKVKENLCIK